MSFSHTITVLDFTAQIGLHALAQLSGSGTLTTATQQRCWRQLALAHVAGAPLVDWHRPAQVGDLEQLQPDVAATAVLMGPGSIHLLEAALGSDVLHTSKAVWIFLLPNAVLARHAIDAALRTRPHPNVQVFQLPNSDPKTLWFILMEQLGKLQVLASPPSLTDQHTMTTNLKESMNTAMGIDGAMAVALVDYRSGMCLAQAGSGMNLDLAAGAAHQTFGAIGFTYEHTLHFATRRLWSWRGEALGRRDFAELYAAAWRPAAGRGSSSASPPRFPSPALAVLCARSPTTRRRHSCSSNIETFGKRSTPSRSVWSTAGW